MLPFEDLDFAKVDHHRSIRKGFPEVIYAKGKNKDQVVSIAKSILSKSSNLLITRSNNETFLEIKNFYKEAKFDELSKIIYINRPSQRSKIPGILVIAAGTSDIPIAKEAIITSEVMGCKVESLFDVGVAGLHRLLSHLELIKKAKVIVVTAGMDGALPSVISGLVDTPIIAVPTSIGYGSSFNGLAALLTMMNSCSPGVSVVNIDNGFGAGYIASSILLNYQKYEN